MMPARRINSPKNKTTTTTPVKKPPIIGRSTSATKEQILNAITPPIHQTINQIMDIISTFKTTLKNLINKLYESISKHRPFTMDRLP
jgi:hypothetical protein